MVRVYLQFFSAYIYEIINVNRLSVTFGNSRAAKILRIFEVRTVQFI